MQHSAQHSLGTVLPALSSVFVAECGATQLRFKLLAARRADSELQARINSATAKVNWRDKHLSEPSTARSRRAWRLGGVLGPRNSNFFLVEVQVRTGLVLFGCRK